MKRKKKPEKIDFLVENSQSKDHRVSKIDLSYDKEEEGNEEKEGNYFRSIEHEFSKKRSLL